MNSISLQGKAFTPTKIVCVGRNYVDHIKELGNEMPSQPVIFIKPNSAISSTVHSSDQDEIHFEAELSFMLAGGSLAAVGFGLDLTKRDIQSQLKAKGLPWERSKAFDGSAVFSDFVPLDTDITGLRLELHINDRLVQQGGYDLMILKPDEIQREVESFLSLEDGDLIMTGTPKGVGRLFAGDRFCGRIFSDKKLLIEAAWTVQ